MGPSVRRLSTVPNPDPWAPQPVTAAACRCGGRGVIWTWAWPNRGEPQHWVLRRCWWCQPRPVDGTAKPGEVCDYCLGQGDVKARFFRAGLSSLKGDITKNYFCPVCSDGSEQDNYQNSRYRYGASALGIVPDRKPET